MTTTTETAPAEADTVATEGLTLPELIAGQLCSLHQQHGHALRLRGTPQGADVALDITRYDFHSSDDITMRVLLTISEPVPYEPAEPAEDGVEIGASA